LKCSKMNWIMIVLFHPEGKVWVDFSIHTNSCGKKTTTFLTLLFLSNVHSTLITTYTKKHVSVTSSFIFTLCYNFFMSRLISLL